MVVFNLYMSILVNIILNNPPMTYTENQYVGFFRNWEMNQSTEEQIQSELELQGIPSSQIESILTLYKKNTQ